MAKAKGEHHRGSFDRRAKRVRDAANADADTRCWRDGLTLAEHEPHRDGTPARWTAGHVIDSDPTSPLMPEASTCNFAAGGVSGQRRRGSGYDWP